MSVDDLISKYQVEVASLRDDHLTSMAEGIANEMLANYLEFTVIEDLKKLRDQLIWLERHFDMMKVIGSIPISRI